MAHEIVTINLNEEDLIGNRTVGSPGTVRSISVNQIDGSFLATDPLLNNGTIRIYPQNPNNNNYDIEIINVLRGTIPLNMPMDAKWDEIRQRIWIADMGNSRVVCLDSRDFSIVFIINNIYFPHSIVINSNNGECFVKGFNSDTMGKIYCIDGFGQLNDTFTYPEVFPWSEFKFERNVHFVRAIPHVRSMVFDNNRSKLWWIADSYSYMAETISKTTTYFNLFNYISVNIENIQTYLMSSLISPNPKIFGNFGYSVSINGDYAIVAAYREDSSGYTQSGRSYIYKRNGEDWNLMSSLISPNPKNSGWFGDSVSIDGDYAIVGAIFEDSPGYVGSGRSYIYKRTGEDWNLMSSLISPNPKSSGRFGSSVSIDGDYVIVGASNEDSPGYDSSGRSYIYKRNGEDWNLMSSLISSNPRNIGLFGYSVSINGNYVIVGAIIENCPGYNFSGRSYIYKRNGEDWNLMSSLISPNPKSSGNFGRSVSINGDYAIVGALIEDSPGYVDSGRSYIYKRTGEDWNLMSSLISPNPKSSGRFGSSVSINGDYAIVGALIEDSPGYVDSGRSYIYKRTGEDWNLMSSLISSNPKTSGYFGFSVSIDVDYAIVGARSEDSPGYVDSGRSYIYKFIESESSESVDTDRKIKTIDIDYSIGNAFISGESTNGSLILQIYKDNNKFLGKSIVV